MTDENATTVFRAAQYVRMSTEHQQYSTHNQADKIKEYAQRRGIEIVCTYADDGKSGLSIDGRAALQKLISDVETGAADFELILVYDVSRWGRFQDADESAYYEYICKRKGISVAYVAEQFENDGSPVSTIVKGVKRAMAGEYSRELSERTANSLNRSCFMSHYSIKCLVFGVFKTTKHLKSERILTMMARYEILRERVELTTRQL